VTYETARGILSAACASLDVPEEKLKRHVVLICHPDKWARAERTKEMNAQSFWKAKEVRSIVEAAFERVSTWYSEANPSTPMGDCVRLVRRQRTRTKQLGETICSEEGRLRYPANLVKMFQRYAVGDERSLVVTLQTAIRGMLGRLTAVAARLKQDAHKQAASKHDATETSGASGNASKLTKLQHERIETQKAAAMKKRHKKHEDADARAAEVDEISLKQWLKTHAPPPRVEDTDLTVECIRNATTELLSIVAPADGSVHEKRLALESYLKSVGVEGYACSTLIVGEGLLQSVGGTAQERADLQASMDKLSVNQRCKLWATLHNEIEFGLSSFLTGRQGKGKTDIGVLFCCINNLRTSVNMGAISTTHCGVAVLREKGLVKLATVASERGLGYKDGITASEIYESITDRNSAQWFSKAKARKVYLNAQQVAFTDEIAIMNEPIRIMLQVEEMLVARGHRAHLTPWLFSGDFFQLPPVKRGTDPWSDDPSNPRGVRFLFQCPEWQRKIGNRVVELDGQNWRAIGDCLRRFLEEVEEGLADDRSGIPGASVLFVIILRLPVVIVGAVV